MFLVITRVFFFLFARAREPIGRETARVSVKILTRDDSRVAAQIDRATRSHSFELRTDSAGDFGIVAANWSTP